LKQRVELFYRFILAFIPPALQLPESLPGGLPDFVPESMNLLLAFSKKHI
jgi:hypothetical protein